MLGSKYFPLLGRLRLLAINPKLASVLHCNVSGFKPMIFLPGPI